MKKKKKAYEIQASKHFGLKEIDMILTTGKHQSKKL